MSAPSTDDQSASGASVSSHQSVKHHTRIRNAALLAVLIIGIILLWPAKWGGLFGIIVVDGHSMEPTFYTGDVVISMKSTDYHVGDIIAYQVSDSKIGKGGHVIHRVVKIAQVNGQSIYTTKGDNNPGTDPWSVTKSDIFGKKLLIIPKIGTYLDSSQGSILLGAILATVVVVAIWPSSSRHGKRSRHAQQ